MLRRTRVSPTFADHPRDPMEIEGMKCSRHGRNWKTTLIEKYGNGVVLSCLFGLISGEREGCWATKVAALSIRPLVAPGIVMNLD